MTQTACDRGDLCHYVKALDSRWLAGCYAKSHTKLIIQTALLVQA